jgi:lipoic acid synthetase
VLKEAVLEILDWGYIAYDEALRRQYRLVEERINGSAPDRLVLLEHPPVVTLGRSGSRNDLCLSEADIDQKGIDLFAVDRGGQATFHGPGQLIVYPIIQLDQKDVHAYLNALLAVVATVVQAYGLKPVLKNGRPGVWVNSGKIASVGIAVKKWVTYHGAALNVSSDLEGFKWIIPCGHLGERITSLQAQLNRSIQLAEVKDTFVNEFLHIFGYSTKSGCARSTSRHPDWLIRPAPNPAAIERFEGLLEKLQLGTVCQNAHCPNLGECFSRGTAAFMILGSCCTRSCRFCAVEKGTPAAPDSLEPQRIARAVAALNLDYVVITSVTRDDLADGGAGQFCLTLGRIRNCSRPAKIEVLIPDFNGSLDALQQLCNARPDMLNHNIETVARLYRAVRPGALYRRSLGILEFAARQRLPVKSGMMLGMGETRQEISETLVDLRRAGCRYVTLGQYLAPSKKHHPVVRYVTPDEFNEWAEFARQMGFEEVTAGPLVRSSYRADDMLAKLKCCKGDGRSPHRPKKRPCGGRGRDSPGAMCAPNRP